MADIFTTDSTTPEAAIDETVTFNDLVGEGKKYKDTDAIAKKVLHADMTIAARERELAGLRQELARRNAEVDSANRLAEIADKLSRVTEPPSTPVTQPDEQGSRDKPEWTLEDVKKAAVETFALERQKALQSTNRELVVSTLKEKLGNDYPEKLRQKLSSLNLTEDQANGLAVQNPQAFFAMIGLTAETTPAPVNVDTPFAPPRSTISTAFRPTANQKNWDHYEAMRRSPDPKERERYWSVSVQNEIHKQALASPDPEAFYKR